MLTHRWPILIALSIALCIVANWCKITLQCLIEVKQECGDDISIATIFDPIGDAVEEAEETDTSLSSVSIARRPFFNLCFAYDIDLLRSGEKGLEELKTEGNSG